MKLRCVVCEHVQDAEHLAVACEGCGARQTMKMAPVEGGLRPGEPIVGVSRVPISRPPLSQLRGPLDEPLEVTRQRHRLAGVLMEQGVRLEEARARALAEVPVQCGSCGGRSVACGYCCGRATAPTEAWRAARAKPAAKVKRKRRPKAPPGGSVARVADPGV